MKDKEHKIKDIDLWNFKKIAIVNPNYHYYLKHLLFKKKECFISIVNNTKVYNYILTLSREQNKHQLTAVIKSNNNNLLDHLNYNDSINICGQMLKSKQKNNENYLI